MEAIPHLRFLRAPLGVVPLSCLVDLVVKHWAVMPRSGAMRSHTPPRPQCASSWPPHQRTWKVMLRALSPISPPCMHHGCPTRLPMPIRGGSLMLSTSESSLWIARALRMWKLSVSGSPSTIASCAPHICVAVPGLLASCLSLLPLQLFCCHVALCRDVRITIGARWLL